MISALPATVRHLLALFGPLDSPPAPIVDAVTELVATALPALRRHFDPENRRHFHQVREIVIAYGCGYQQVKILGLEHWSGLWPKAHETLRNLVGHFVRGTSDWLEFCASVPGFDVARANNTDSNATEWITNTLISGNCSCYKRYEDGPVRRLGSNAANDRKRVKRCAQQHPLLAWRPGQMSLAGFVARAVKGSLSSHDTGRMLYSVGSLMQSLYFAFSARDSGLRAAPVLTWRCWRDQHWNFYGWPCRHCQQQKGLLVEATPLTPLSTRRWLILPSELGGAFHPRKFWKCRECHHRYPHHLSACPLDGITPGRGEKPSIVWVPTRGLNLELDAPIDDEAAISAADQAALETWNPDQCARWIDAKAMAPRLKGDQRGELMTVLTARF